MSTKPIISPGGLFRMLGSAFDERRPAECSTCRVPLPYAVPRADDGSANWRLETPRECPHNCAAVLAELVANLAARYDMSDYTLNPERQEQQTA